MTQLRLTSLTKTAMMQGVKFDAAASREEAVPFFKDRLALVIQVYVCLIIVLMKTV